MSKRNIRASIIVILVTLLLTFSFSYAYYTIKKELNGSKLEISAVQFTLNGESKKIMMFQFQFQQIF